MLNYFKKRIKRADLNSEIPMLEGILLVNRSCAIKNGQQVCTYIGATQCTYCSQALTERMHMQLKCTDWLCDEMAVPSIRNCSAQILLFLAGEQFAPPTPGCLRDILPGSDFHKLFSTVWPFTTDIHFCAERITNSRSKSTHCSNLQELDDMVLRAITTIKTFKQLKCICPDEVAIIDNYAVFRSLISQEHTNTKCVDETTLHTLAVDIVSIFICSQAIKQKEKT